MTASYEIRELTPFEVRFAKNRDNLTLTLSDGTFYGRTELRRCFPMSEGTQFISVRDPNTDDHDEIGVIMDYGLLSEADRELVEEALELFYFVPKITQVRSVKEEFGFLYWQVLTDKGELEFVMRDSIMSYVREVSATRYVVIDINKTRYEIPDLLALDSHSQGLVRRMLCI